CGLSVWRGCCLPLLCVGDIETVLGLARGDALAEPKDGWLYTAATLATFFRPRRSGMGRSRALVNVRTTSRSTRPRISISWRGASSRSVPARGAPASEATGPQAQVLVRAWMRLAVLTESPTAVIETAVP